MNHTIISIIVAVDQKNGIAKNGKLPWQTQLKNKNEIKYFKDTTIGKGNNAVIMGKNTYLSIPNNFRPLKERTNIIISKTLNTNDNIIVFRTIEEAEEYIKMESFDEVFICGGEQIYTYFIEKHEYDRLYLTIFNNDYNCDQFIRLTDLSNKKLLDKKINDNYNTFIYDMN